MTSLICTFSALLARALLRLPYLQISRPFFSVGLAILRHRILARDLI